MEIIHLLLKCSNSDTGNMSSNRIGDCSGLRGGKWGWGGWVGGGTFLMGFSFVLLIYLFLSLFVFIFYCFGFSRPFITLLITDYNRPKCSPECQLITLRIVICCTKVPL